MKQMEQVIEFNDRVLGIKPRRAGLMPDKEAEHLKKCLDEESREFLQAFHSGDIIGMLDSLLDNMYFNLGGFYKMGLTPAVVMEMFTAVHEANMEKKLGVVAARSTGAPDAVKPAGWVPPEERIAAILDRYIADQEVVFGREAA